MQQSQMKPCPPCFSDLGKQAREMFTKGYHFGLVKLELKTRAKNGVTFTVTGHSHNDSEKVCGSVEIKHKLKPWCMTISEKWNTDNTVETEFLLEDGFFACMPGLKIALNASMAPQTGSKIGRAKAIFKRECICINTDVEFETLGPVINSAIVMAYCNWLVGYQVAIDTYMSKLTKNNLAVGYDLYGFALNFNINNENDNLEFTGTTHRRLNKCLEFGSQVSWNGSGEVTSFGIGGKYTVDNYTSFSAKVNNESQVGVGYSQIIREGIKLTLSAMIDGKNFNQGGHRIGIALELEP